ncbi:MAG: hypothetical protein JNM84_23010 [Planctomycetes bacterium]|nr:hypothetical protein [Planctomycetota bacterium]
MTFGSDPDAPVPPRSRRLARYAPWLAARCLLSRRLARYAPWLAARCLLSRRLARYAPWLAALVLLWPVALRFSAERDALSRSAIAIPGGAPLAAFPLDDAYIYQVYGRNLARGEGYAFNAGRPDSAATALLWALALAGVHAQDAVDPVLATKILGVLCALLACGFLGSAVARWTDSASAGAIASLALALTPRVAWSALAGMDPPLTLALVAAALRFGTGPNPRALALALLALAGFSRPEAFALLPLALGAALLARLDRREKPPAERSPRALELRCALFAVGAIGAYGLANFLLAGDPLPSTFRAKVGPASLLEVARGRAELSAVLARLGELPWKLWFFLWQDRGLLLVPALFGLALLLPSRREPLRGLLPLLLIAYPLAKELFAPSFNDLLFQHGRQAALLSLALAAGLGAVLGALPQRRGGVVLTPLLFAAPFLAALWELWPPVAPEAQGAFAELLQAELSDQRTWIVRAAFAGVLLSALVGIAALRALRALRREPERSAEWRARAPRAMALALALALGGAGLLRSAFEEPARANEQGGDVELIAKMHVATGRWLAAHTPREARIGANDIGAIGYYSERKIVDLFGLLDARLLRFRRHASGGVGATHAERSDLEAAFLAEPGLGCDYLALFPEWYPELLRELGSAPAGAPAIRGGPLYTVIVPPNPTTGATVKWVLAIENAR